MSSRLYFGEDDFLRCRFAVSPLWETQEAVRTLKRPDRHGYHAPWLRRIRTAAEAVDLSGLWLLMPRRGHCPDWLCPPPIGPAAGFEEEIAAVRAADPDAAREDTARSLVCTPGALESPQGRAWLAEVGLGGLLPEIHRSCGWESGTLTIASAFTHERHLGGQGLVLMPSVFAWPDVVSGFDPPWQPTVVYPVRGIGGLWTDPADRSPEALVRLLGRGRAAVLTALDEPATTSALAHRLGLAPSSVSAHLTVLRDSGLLVSRRYGHQVLYERTPLGIALVSGGA
jgi:hypothetical protein